MHIRATICSKTGNVIGEPSGSKRGGAARSSQNSRLVPDCVRMKSQSSVFHLFRYAPSF